MDILFLIGRIIYGGFFFLMGMNHFMKKNELVQYASAKKVKSPGAAVFISGILLLIGGLTILFGTYVSYGVAALVIFLLPVSFQMHAFWKEQDPNVKMTEMAMFLKNMALAGAALMMLAVPEPWVFSV